MTGLLGFGVALPAASAPGAAGGSRDSLYSYTSARGVLAVRDWHPARSHLVFRPLRYSVPSCRALSSVRPSQMCGIFPSPALLGPGRELQSAAGDHRVGFEGHFVLGRRRRGGDLLLRTIIRIHADSARSHVTVTREIGEHGAMIRRKEWQEDIPREFH